MTTDNMMDDLVDVLQDIFADEVYGEPYGERRRLKVYKDGLPIEEANDDDIESRTPFGIVKFLAEDVDNGISSSRVAIVLCNRDDAGSYAGARSLRHQIHLIKDRFLRHPEFTMYTVQSRMSIVAQDPDDSFPYIYGGIELTIDGPPTEREDDFA